MSDQDRQAKGPAPGDESAEMRLRGVVTVFDNGSLWPVDGERPDIMRGSIATEVQADSDRAIDDAFDIATDIKPVGPAGLTHVLREDVRAWIKATSTIPGGNGATNGDRLHQAFAAADQGRFRPGEFGLLWQELRTLPRSG